MAQEDGLPQPSRTLSERFRRLPPLGTFEPIPGPPGPAWCEPILERVLGRFERATVGGPAAPAAVERLRAALPSCPPELTEFVRRCDGIDAECDVYGCVYGIDRMIETRSWIVEPWGPRLVPLRGDGCGDEDCLVVGTGPCEGAVVFCDREQMGPAYLLASNLWSYLDMWSDMLVHTYLPDGRPVGRAEEFESELGRERRGLEGAFLIGAFLQALSRDRRLREALEHPWPFDEKWMRRRDPGLAPLLRSREVRRWLATHGH